jgi:hypothetical protein
LFDSRYINNLVAGKEFITGKKKTNILAINGKLIWSGNMRDTPVDTALSRVEESTVYIQKQRNTINLEDYMRFDIGVSYRINRPKVSHIISLDIQNVTNRLNIEERDWNEEDRILETDHLSGILPIFNYRIEF